MQRITIDDFKNYKFISNPEFSPSGKNFLFKVGRVKEDLSNYESAIWNLDNKKITSYDISKFLFLNDDEILFLSSSDKKDKYKPQTTIYKLSLNGGEREEFLKLDIDIANFFVLDENTLVVLENFDLAKKELYDSGNDKDKIIDKLKEDEDYDVFTELPFWGNGAGITDGKRVVLGIYSIKNKSYLRISDYPNDVENIDINRDTKEIIYTLNEFKNVMPLNNSIFIYNAETKENREITPLFGVSYGSVRFFGDNIFCTMSDMKSHGINENSDFLLFDKNDKHIIKKVKHDLGKGNSVGSDVRYGGGKNFIVDGEKIYFNTTEGFSTQIFSLDKNLNIKKHTNIEGSVDSFSVKNGKIFAVILLPNRLQEIYEIGDTDKKLTNINEDSLKDKCIVSVEKIDYKLEENPHTGFLMMPPHSDAKNKIPGILYIHGGPKTVYGNVFFHEMQYLSQLGYAIFFTNPRGSDGYGNDFADIRGKYGDVDYKDLMDFTDHILNEFPKIDKDNLFVMGGSYGGFMTNWIISHTDRFKAAVSQRSISNWISMWGTTDIGYYFATDQTDANPFTLHEKMWEQSPLKHSYRAKTPTLFIHSKEDYRCYMVEAMQMYTSLKLNGVDSKMVLFHGENHELSRSGKPKHRIRRLKEISDWIEKHKK